MWVRESFVRGCIVKIFIGKKIIIFFDRNDYMVVDLIFLNKYKSERHRKICTL